MSIPRFALFGRRVFPTLAVLLVGLLVAFGAAANEPGGNPPAEIPEVTTVTATKRPLALKATLNGRTQAHLVAEVRPQVNGIVQSRLFREGADVKEGEQLYQIDPSLYQAAFDNAKGALAKAEANVGPAKRRSERLDALAKASAVSRQDQEDAFAAGRQAEAEVVAAKAALETARINLAHTRILAPISGRIGKSAVTPGALVTANQQTALAVIQRIDPIYVDMTQSSVELLRFKRELAGGRLKKNEARSAKVRLFFEDGVPYVHEGALQFSDITVDQGAGVVTLRAEFPNPDLDLLPGLYVRSVIEVGVDEQALLVPQQAVIRDAKGAAQVLVVGQDGLVGVRPVELGRAVDNDWPVLSGLEAGERVIVEGLQKARPGAPVKAVEAAPQSARNETRGVE